MDSTLKGKPRAVVTRRLPEAVEHRLTTLLDVQLNTSDRPLDADELAALMQQADILVPTITDRIDAALLGTLGSRVRLIANYGAGVDHIDLEAARSAGIAVTNTPDALTDATAELAILLMLMAARRGGEGEREIRAGTWTGWRPTHLVGQGLSGKTLGLVGFGRIARCTAKKASGLGMKVLHFSRRAAESQPDCDSLGSTTVGSLRELVSRSDVISLHVPGGSETHHMIDKALLEAVKPGAIIVNTARGSIIDEEALADALEAGRVAAVGLDVYECEPVVNQRLIAQPRAVLLPHLGSATVETRGAMGMQMIDNVRAYLLGEDLPNRVV